MKDIKSQLDQIHLDTVILYLFSRLTLFSLSSHVIFLTLTYGD